mmetsp:Transcript_23555/g.53751  ORF Transcript_23555/g.53751 Transcript_23555/m.53751 type:complete len:86 (-) Transcript_23555:365-622(-)
MDKLKKKKQEISMKKRGINSSLGSNHLFSHNEFSLSPGKKKITIIHPNVLQPIGVTDYLNSMDNLNNKKSWKKVLLVAEAKNLAK